MAQNWAICIGINHYNFCPDLSFAVNDATQMAAWLAGKAGFQTYVFTDDSEEITDMSSPMSSRPTFTTLRRWLRKRFPENQPCLKPEDSLWFFFSGHGIREQGQDYLLLSDSDPDPEEVDNSALSLVMVTEYLRRSGAGNIMMFVDACRNQGSRSALGIELQPTQGIISFASCSPLEKSYEIESLGHGSFTLALLESLQIQGEGNCATVERLSLRLRRRVTEINQAHGFPTQTPYEKIEPSSKHHLIYLPDVITPTLKDVSVLREKAFRAEAQGDLRLAEILWRRLVKYDTDEALESLMRLREKQKAVSDLSPPVTPERIVTDPIVSKLGDQDAVQPAIVVSKGTTDTQTVLERIVEILPGGVELELIKIPAGSFMMGSLDSDEMANSDEKPQHRVNVKTFYMGQYPITQAQYEAVMGENPSYFKDKPSHPVENVSWHDAQKFCEKLREKTGKKYRLPSEAEWEYACRAGTTTQYCFGDNAAKLGDYGWHRDNSNSQTQPVGKKKPNPWGLYDVHGNVWEWCEDTWHDNYQGAPKDESSWVQDDGSYHVLRGGSWFSFPRSCRAAIPFGFAPGDRVNIIGLRVVVSVP